MRAFTSWGRRSWLFVGAPGPYCKPARKDDLPISRLVRAKTRLLSPMQTAASRRLPLMSAEVPAEIVRCAARWEARGRTMGAGAERSCAYRLTAFAGFERVVRNRKRGIRVLRASSRAMEPITHPICRGERHEMRTIILFVNHSFIREWLVFPGGGFEPKPG